MSARRTGGMADRAIGPAGEIRSAPRAMWLALSAAGALGSPGMRCRVPATSPGRRIALATVLRQFAMRSQALTLARGLLHRWAMPMRLLLAVILALAPGCKSMGSVMSGFGKVAAGAARVVPDAARGVAHATP